MAKIRVMISSRCSDHVQKSVNDKSVIALSDVRKKLKAQIENIEILGKKPFEVWMHEDSPDGEGGHLIWEDCILNTKKSDMVLVLYNGKAGFTDKQSQLGICHAELKTALSTGPSRVRIIELPVMKSSDKKDISFRDFYSKSLRFRLGEAKYESEIYKLADKAIYDSLIEICKVGAKEARRSKHDLGEALEWSKLSFEKRAEEIIASMVRSLSSRTDFIRAKDRVLLYEFCKKQLPILVSSLPASFSVSKSREILGRPSFKEHQIDYLVKMSPGPIHFVGCYKTISESQIMSLVGDPDVVIVKSTFGFYVYDQLHHVQYVFLLNCRDETSVFFSIDRFFGWLDQSNESNNVFKRCEKRGKILKVLSVV